MKLRKWIDPLAAVVFVGASNEAALRLLRPRKDIIAADPVRVADHFSEAEIRRSRRYGRGQMAIGAFGGVVEAALLVWLARTRPRVLAARNGHPVLAGAAAAAALSAGSTAIGLAPAALARRRALAVGLDTQRWRPWAMDIAKSTAISSVFSGGGAAATLALMRRYGREWWLPAAGATIALGAGATFVGPILLDPIFNRFNELEEGQTRDDVLALAAAASVRVKGVYSVDASRRTSAANAYVNGLGATRRVVLYDTLLSSFTREETRLVVAHELAHVRHRDIGRGLAFIALVAPSTLNAVAALTQIFDGDAAAAGPQTLVPLVLAFALVSSTSVSFSSRLSRQLERRADSFSLRLTDSPQAFVSFERKIALQNLANPQPSRWLSKVFATHPPTAERIGIAEAYARGAR